MQGTLNFLKLNNLFSTAFEINICMKNCGNNTRNENDVESDVEQWQSNSETHQINNFETMDKTFVMLGKGVDTFKRDMVVTPLRPINEEKTYQRAEIHLLK